VEKRAHNKHSTIDDVQVLDNVPTSGSGNSSKGQSSVSASGGVGGVKVAAKGFRVVGALTKAAKKAAHRDRLAFSEFCNLVSRKKERKCVHVSAGPFPDFVSSSVAVS
jgi:hypothetical protein